MRVLKLASLYDYLMKKGHHHIKLVKYNIWTKYLIGPKIDENKQMCEKHSP